MFVYNIQSIHLVFFVSHSFLIPQDVVLCMPIIADIELKDDLLCTSKM